MNFKGLVSKLKNFLNDFIRPEMINPRVDLKGKYIKEGNIYCIIPKHHGCTIEIVSAKSGHEDQNLKK